MWIKINLKWGRHGLPEFVPLCAESFLCTEWEGTASPIMDHKLWDSGIVLEHGGEFYGFEG